jgi:ABC-type polysaccharide/polyol phosphate transport system ATPase subunit
LSGTIMNAITCREVSKAFRIYHERNQTLKQALLRRRTASFDERWALRQLDLEIRTGETFGIIGGNGAGKSTTLKIFAGILVPDRGTVETVGRVSALLELGAGFHPELTGRENVFLNGSILGVSRRTLNEKYDEIVAFSGLDQHMDLPIKTYSSGMYARLGFAVAVHVDPDILLIDEVLAVGDEMFQRRCAEKITEMRTGGRTVVIVSHALGSLRTMCDRVAWFSEGRLAGIGIPGETIDQYLETVRPTATVDEHGRIRTGSGEARANARLLEQPRTGAPLTFVFSVRRHGDRSTLLLSMTIRRNDGVVVAGSNVTIMPSSDEVTDLAFRLATLALLPGSYELALRVSDPTGGHEIDRSDHELSFDVAPGTDHAVYEGICHLFGAWSNLHAEVPGSEDSEDRR